MSIPQFTPQTVSENTTTTLPQIVRILNSLFTNLNQIFTYLKTKNQLDTIQLTNVQLVAGTNIIPHTLGKTLTGWYITRYRNTAATIYDTQDSNSNKNTYLQLVSDTTISVDILVY